MLEGKNNKIHPDLLEEDKNSKKKNGISTKQLAIIFVGAVVVLLALLFFAMSSDEKTVNINTNINEKDIKAPPIIDQNSFDEEAIKSIKNSVENSSTLDNNTTTKIDNSPYLRPPIIVEEIKQIPKQHDAVIQQPAIKIQPAIKEVASSNNNLEEEIYNNIKNYMQSIKNDITLGSDYFIYKNKKYYENDLINGYKILEIGDYFIRVYEENWTYKLRILGDK